MWQYLLADLICRHPDNCERLSKYLTNLYGLLADLHRSGVKFIWTGNDRMNYCRVHSIWFSISHRQKSLWLCLFQIVPSFWFFQSDIHRCWYRQGNFTVNFKTFFYIASVYRADRPFWPQTQTFFTGQSKVEILRLSTWKYLQR
jgi:hypothetical protein